MHFFNYVMRKVWLHQTRIGLSLYDVAGLGYLRESVRFLFYSAALLLLHHATYLQRMFLLSNLQNASADLIYPNKSPLKSQVRVMAHIGKRKLWSIFWKKRQILWTTMKIHSKVLTMMLVHVIVNSVRDVCSLVIIDDDVITV